MTAGDDEFFSRWSRRKLAARQPLPVKEAEQPATRGADADTDLSAVEANMPDAAPAEGPGEAAASPPTQEADPLPRIEDLEAGGDLSAFLREGVPAALRNRALRTMWSLDPAIRDHVGLAEYAWDFNDPTAMAGFGPLEAGSRVVDFLSATVRTALAGREEAEEASGQAASAPTAPGDAVPSELDAVPESESATAAAAGPGAADSGPADGEAGAEVPTEAGAIPVGMPASAESAPKRSRRRHGGALPQ